MSLDLFVVLSGAPIVRPGYYHPGTLDYLNEVIPRKASGLCLDIAPATLGHSLIT
jgi:hypothetical protein